MMADPRVDIGQASHSTGDTSRLGGRTRHPALGDRDAGRRAVNRMRLSDRRRADTRAFEHDGMRFTVTIAFYADGRPGEVFAHGARAGSMMNGILDDACVRSEEHTSELQSLMRISYAVFCLKKKKNT